MPSGSSSGAADDEVSSTQEKPAMPLASLAVHSKEGSSSATGSSGDGWVARRQAGDLRRREVQDDVVLELEHGAVLVAELAVHAARAVSPRQRDAAAVAVGRPRRPVARLRRVPGRRGDAHRSGAGDFAVHGGGGLERVSGPVVHAHRALGPVVRQVLHVVDPGRVATVPGEQVVLHVHPVDHPGPGGDVAAELHPVLLTRLLDPAGEPVAAHAQVHVERRAWAPS